jgi:hypothetical protein
VTTTADDIAALQAALIAERARAARVEAELAVGQGQGLRRSSLSRHCAAIGEN